MQELKFGTKTPIEYNEKQLGMTIGIKVMGNITFHEEVRDEKKEMIMAPFMKAIASKLKEYEEKDVPLEHLSAMGLEMNRYLEGILDALNAPGKVIIMSIMPDEASRKAIEAKSLAASPEAMAATLNQAAAQAQAMAQASAAAQAPAAAQEMAAAHAQATAQASAVAQTQAMTQTSTAAAAQTQAMTQTSTAAAPLAATIKYKSSQANAKRPKFCTNCGTPVGPSGNFCINCGTRLSGMI